MVTKENREKERVAREKMASFFLDLAKLTLAAMVLGSMTPIFRDGTTWDWLTFTLGLIATVIFARIGNNILN